MALRCACVILLLFYPAFLIFFTVVCLALSAIKSASKSSGSDR